MATPYRIREGTMEDLDELHRLMQESTTNGAKNATLIPSIETLRTYGFTDPRYFHFLVTENSTDQGNGATCEENSLIGYLIFCKSFSTEVGKIIILKDLYVMPEYRRKGAAKDMWKSILKFAVMEKFGRVQWSVKNSDTELLKYSQNYGLTNLIQKEGWYVFNMNKTEIQCVK